MKSLSLFFILISLLPIQVGHATCLGDLNSLFLRHDDVGYPPLVAQIQDQNCGPAALRSWLLSKGIHLSESELAVILKTNANGTEASDFIAGLKHLRFDAEFKKNLTLNDLSLAQAEGKGVLVNIQLEGEGHWALLVKIGEEITLMDPWIARNKNYQFLSPEKFLKSWFGHNGGSLSPHAAIFIK